MNHPIKNAAIIQELLCGRTIQYMLGTGVGVWVDYDPNNPAENMNPFLNDETKWQVKKDPKFEALAEWSENRIDVDIKHEFAFKCGWTRCAKYYKVGDYSNDSYTRKSRI